ncbi:MAG: ECF transporter S component [Candidatus Bathyarchaeota archaeon]|nr:ECF transporter S component [Candidatus Bathyarchaeota archaeon]
MEPDIMVQKTSKEGEAKAKTLSIAMVTVCAALYALIGRITDLSITGPGGVAFWPAVVIPAVFATLFGPWVGGTGAAIGIFIRDMLFHGDALLSLSAGVTANFVGFFILGQITRSTLNQEKVIVSSVIGSIIIIIGLLSPTVLLPAESQKYFSFELSSLEITLLFAATVISSLLIIAVFSKLWPDWRNYAVGSVMGLSAGSTIIAIVVWAYSQIFFGPTAYFRQPIPHSLIPIIFIWTFATEIPFMVILGPPIIKACYKAFPFLRPQKEKKTT